MNKRVLIIMAHQDDEAAFSTRISREIKFGNSVTCVYLTDGSANGHDPRVRDEQSLRVLRDLGVSKHRIHFIGSQHQIPDGKLIDHLERTYEILEEAVGEHQYHRLYCLAYEGGHHDHDACHLVAAVFSARRNLLTRTWQMPMYNGFRTRFFRVMFPIPRSTRTLTRRLSLREASMHTVSVLQYRSEWKTWVGLLPELTYQRLVRRRETLQAVNVRDLFERPHAGPLLYERMYGFSHQQFRTAADSFLHNML